MRPAIRLVFAPLLSRFKKERESGKVVHGTTIDRTIRLDPRSTNILDTLVHEMTHVGHPSWTEQEVNAHTKNRIKKASWKEKARLLKMLASATIEGEVEE